MKMSAKKMNAFGAAAANHMGFLFGNEANEGVVTGANFGKLSTQRNISNSQ